MKTTETKNKSIENELIKIKQQEQEKEQRRLELLKLQNPEIVYDQLQKTDTRISYKGTINYSDIILNDRWYGHKELNVNLNYNFGIGIDNNKIVVKEFYDDIVIIQIPKNEMRLQYIGLDNKTSNLTSDKSLWIKDYSPDDIDIILKQSQDKITKQVSNNKEFYNQAMVNAKENIKKQVMSLGYGDVIFEEI